MTNTATYNLELSEWSLPILSLTDIKYGFDHNEKDPKYKVDDHAKMSKYKNLLVSMTKELLGHFMKESCKRQVKLNSGLKKKSRENAIDCTSNESAMITNSIAGLKKWYTIRMSQYFPQSYEPSGRNVKLELDLSIYEKKLIRKE